MPVLTEWYLRLRQMTLPLIITISQRNNVDLRAKRTRECLRAQSCPNHARKQEHRHAPTTTRGALPGDTHRLAGGRY